MTEELQDHQDTEEIYQRKWEIRSAIKSVMQYAPIDRDKVMEKVSERVDHASEEQIDSQIHEMLKEGTLFKPDQNSLQRT